ncbi:MAG: cadherin repeat domain-containing protein, partial [Erysipelotrichaceae bacterium]|nr:cadherin repeat domain-containing protein [Erysipelotrichaceae bacterium]
MWKKLFACLVALIVMGSVGYAYFNFQMDAASNYQAGGEIYGRLGDTFIKGDRILTGIVNPNNGNYMVWQILKKESYTDYGCGTTDTVCNNKVISGYITLASESIGKSAYGLTQNDYYYNGLVWGNYRVSKVFQDYLIPFSGSINARNRKIVTYRNLTSFHPNLWFRTCPATVDDPMFQDNAYLIYVGNVEGVLDGGGAISSADLMFDSAYWSNEVANDGGWSQFDASFFTTGGSIGNQLGGGPYNTAIDPDFKLDIRPALTMKLSDVVFAASLGKQGGMAHVKLREATGYSDIRSLEGDPMKVRILNTNMSANLNGIKGKDGSYINQIGEGQKVKLSVTANSGSDEEGNPYTISAVILDHAGNFINYMPLNVTANGESEYEFDVTGLSVGDYQLAVVNEAYSESDYSPADCSKLSSQLTFEIVPAPKIKYQAVYEGSPTTPNTHEYHVNVDVGDTIGKFTVQDGARPIQLSLICDDETDAEHANDYLQFELSKNVLSDNSEVFVKVKSGLHQGVYYFKIKAEDNFGICGYYRVQVTVNKTKLSIQFQQPQQTKKSIAEASTSWNETATANTSDGVKITYSISGGDIYLIDLDPDTGKITYKGAGGYGMVKIKATADDDPNSGNDNYEEAFTEKEVVIYREVDGIVTPHANSSNANVPTFQANDANVKTGGTIGTIKGTQGTPDTIGGNTTTYSYAMKSGENGSFFTVNANSGEIKTSANLAVGTYTFTITVSDKWSSKDIPVTVNVGMAPAEVLNFYENSTS